MTGAKRRTGLLALFFMGLMLISGAPASANQPAPWGMGLQAPASPLAERAGSFHDLLLVIIIAITIFVMILLGWVIYRYNTQKNPTPSKVTHNTLIEVVWTVIPVIILVIVFVPGIRLLYYTDKTKSAEMTIKVTGHQWYWSYEYPDHANLTFDSYMVQDSDLKPGQPRLLEVDNRLVLPVDTDVRILVSTADVMHSWFVPSLGVQKYATPGRTNEIWVRLSKPGVYYGQCNQICGTNHGFMPVAVEGMSKDAFAAWAKEAKTKFAASGATPTVAALPAR